MSQPTGRGAPRGVRRLKQNPNITFTPSHFPTFSPSHFHNFILSHYFHTAFTLFSHYFHNTFTLLSHYFHTTFTHFHTFTLFQLYFHTTFTLPHYFHTTFTNQNTHFTGKYGNSCPFLPFDILYIFLAFSVFLWQN